MVARFNYTKMAIAASNMIYKFGQDAILRKSTHGSYNAATGSAPITTTDYPVTIVTLPTGKDTIPQPNTLVRENQNTVYLSVKGVTSAPQLNDILVIANESWLICEIPQVLSPGGVTVLYELKVKGI